jgi:hypothetical protein
MGKVYDAIGLRSFIRIDCHRISDSCGWGVPRHEFKGHRSQLIAWGEKQGVEGAVQYQKEVYAESLDGLPGITHTIEEDP